MSNLERIKSWRVPRSHQYPYAKGEPHAVKEEYPATRIFDRLCCIGDKWVTSLLLETTEGLVLIDAMEPDDEHLELILRGIRELGHDPGEVRAVIISHGHVDHWGRADYFREKYGAVLYMSEKDTIYAHLPETRSPIGPMPFDITNHLSDGDVFRLGGCSIQVYETPGHTPGCLSFIIPVTDEGRPHKMAYWGGGGAPALPEERAQYIRSCDRFMDICRREGADGELTNHSFVDMTPERLAICRNIIDGVANPFIIGAEATERYLQMYKESCIARG